MATWTFDGWHHWPDAPPHRAYLASRHRHLFHAKVTLAVGHDDREVEFHDLLEAGRLVTPAGREWGSMSCEAIATTIGGHVLRRWPRPLVVEVWEDGECGALVECVP